MSFIKNTKFYKQHPFHIISPTFGPFALAITVWNVLFFFNLYLNVKFTIMPSYCPIKPLTMIYFGITLVLCALYRWGEDISNDAVKGNHTTAIQDGLRVGFILFIISEILLFFSIFWAFAHFSLMPSIWIGSIWPPEGINVLNPVDTPLLNTVILLSSGVFTVWAHHSFIVGDRQTVMFALLLTCLLGLYFSWLQFLEYSLTDFTISDSVYGSIFFFSTGFHGVHVMVGTVLLWIAHCRIANMLVSKERYLGFEFAAWYWHFIDVVWIFLYILLYWWGAAKL